MIWGAVGKWTRLVWGLGFTEEDARRDARRQAGLEMHLDFVELSVEDAKRVANGEKIRR
jgi:hypothetical protein